MSNDNASHQKIKSMSCLVCGIRGVDVAHIKTRGSGGGDDVWNLMPLCRQHHTEQHKIGLLTFAKKHLMVSSYLSDNGWFIYNGKLLNERNVTGESIPPQHGID